MYARFETESKEDAAAFLGADNIIGDAFSIEQEYVDGKRTAWIVNPFGKRMGTIDEKTAEKVDLCNAKGWNTVALLHSLLFTGKALNQALYWGSGSYHFLRPGNMKSLSLRYRKCRKAARRGIRPDVSLGRDSLRRLSKLRANGFLRDAFPSPTRTRALRLGENATHRNGTLD